MHHATIAADAKHTTHDVKLLKTRIGAYYNLKMQGLNNGYVQLVGGRPKKVGVVKMRRPLT